MDGISKDELIQIEGSVEKIIYSNEQNGYTVCELETADELIVTVGIMPYLSEGETIKALGNYVNHKSFGRQFKVEYYEKQLPATESAILKYLSSGTIKGIGPVTAKRIVASYMQDTFDVIENHPEWLADIPGISPRKAREISESFKEQFGMRNVMMFCRDFFGPALSVKIYKELGSGAVDIIKQNPYILCERIDGIGFEKADAIAREVGIAKNSRDRIAAGVKFVLSYNAMANGHVYLPLHKLVPTADKLLSCGENTILSVISERVETGDFVIEKIDKHDCVYTGAYYEEERYIAKKLNTLDGVNHIIDDSNLEALIQKAEFESGINYDARQHKAICDAVNNAVFILTGGPGTGKTTVVRAIIRVFEDMGLRISLCAPTGRASKRMSQAAGLEAKTIHRLLEMEYAEDGELRFSRNENNLLDSDVIIVDEASMVDMDIVYS
ncbi:MAG: AAA family ATPase, partial [Clostridiales bacterium]|nr:AAA family ATPase [Clostridiales bacterium]